MIMTYGVKVASLGVLHLGSNELNAFFVKQYFDSRSFLSDPPPENQPMTRVLFGQHACFMVSKCFYFLLK